MNAVEIEEAASQLASEPFDRAEFPFAFLTSFGNKKTTIDRLRSGASNSSDIPNGVLQRNNIHIATCADGATARALQALKLSPKTVAAKARFVVATDGVTFEAEDLRSDDPPVICNYADFADHFGFFLPLAGISTVKQLRESAFDVRATGRLNKLYVELRKENPDWDKADRQHDMNHFMARLIFCFFAEDTDIFFGNGLFTNTIEQMSAPDGSNAHQVIETIFRAMNLKTDARIAEKLPRWAEAFPYVNGGLFSGSTQVPRFTKMARAFLLNIGRLEWRKINPDIFGSMIQAVADDEERGALGMHYTSVPNILKVLNPLFLDDLREKLAEAGDNPRTLLNLRKRIARIRVFDPACGSGNFLVIAYKQMREIEAEINKRRGEEGKKSEISIKNYRGIELLEFPAEIARLALIIAEYQCDVLYRGQKEALQDFLPLDAENWISSGNALRMDWMSVCPPTGTSVKFFGDDLFRSPLDQAQIDFENEGGETYVCGNPPYSGKGKKDSQQLDDMDHVFSSRTDKYGYVDYVGCWFVLASDYCFEANATAALVATNSICQGRQLTQLWPHVLRKNVEILFAHQSFKWSNSAARNAGVTCVIVCIGDKQRTRMKALYDGELSKAAAHINAYLVDGPDLFVESRPKALSSVLPKMQTGSVPNDGGNLILDLFEVHNLKAEYPKTRALIRPFFGSQDYLQGHLRFCLSIGEDDLSIANSTPPISERLGRVAELRSESKKKETREHLAAVPHQFQHRGEIPIKHAIIIPSVSSERREWFPVGLLGQGTVISNLAFMINDRPLWNMALIASRLHLVWIATVCGKLKTDFRYSNTLGWNTFPVPPLTDQNKVDLNRCAEDILLAREAHFPATIADLYDPETMPDNLREAHERNDEVLERIFIGRRFRNDTERLEKLFELYTKMIASAPKEKTARKKSRGA